MTRKAMLVAVMLLVAQVIASVAAFADSMVVAP